uniref:Uncharacterized protein n=1 Tax=Rhizophora mucronata TaxID=61149 RepID=A0A2P2JHM3_RHIMU
MSKGKKLRSRDIECYFSKRKSNSVFPNTDTEVR